MSSTLAPTLTTGTWNIDASHTTVGFVVRHLMIAKVRGSFTKVSGTVTVPEDPLATLIDVTIDPTSIATADDARDGHLRGSDFLDVEKYGRITFKSTKVTANGDGYQLVGELTIKGVTNAVTLEVDFDGVREDPWGNIKAGFSATGEINRKDWGIEYNAALEAGGVLIGEMVKLQLDVELVRAA